MADRREVKVWLPVEDFEVVDGLARRAGVETGALCREAILRAAGSVARDVSAGAVRLRRRSGAEPRVRMATTAVIGDLGPRDAPVEVPVPAREQPDRPRDTPTRPPTDTVARLMMERQARLNEAKDGGR